MSQAGLLEWLMMLGEWGIVAVIIYEGRIAFREYRSARMFDAIKYVEDWETRKARREVSKKLRETRPPIERWWTGDDEALKEAAASVCARYNLLGAVTKEDKNVRRFVVREWAHNICHSYEALAEYIRYREDPDSRPLPGSPGAFRHYTELYREAKQTMPARAQNRSTEST